MTAMISIGSATASVAAAPPPTSIKARPDLYVQSINVMPVIGVAASNQVRVSVRVGARAQAKLSTGPFRIKVEWREKVVPAPDRRVLTRSGSLWTALPEASSTGLTVDPTSSKVPMVTRAFIATLPWGRTYELRATVDSMHQVDEADETNNEATSEYEATFCAGGKADLGLTRMRLERQPDGGTIIDVWIANTCPTDCSADIYYLIDESGAIGVDRGLERRIAVRVEGDSEIGPVGRTVADGVAGEDATYTVRLEARGAGCPETNTANNSCSGTIRAGEATKIVDCRAPAYVVWDR